MQKLHFSHHSSTLFLFIFWLNCLEYLLIFLLYFLYPNRLIIINQTLHRFPFYSNYNGIQAFNFFHLIQHFLLSFHYVKLLLYFQKFSISYFRFDKLFLNMFLYFPNLAHYFNSRTSFYYYSYFLGLMS